MPDDRRAEPRIDVPDRTAREHFDPVTKINRKSRLTERISFATLSVRHLLIWRASEMAMLEHDFRSDVGYWIHIAAHRFERAMNEELAREGMTYRQGQVLAWLALDGELAQIELAERMNVEPPTLVKVLDRMQRDGLISRDPCPADRRRKYVRPTDKAIPIWERIVGCANRVRDRSVLGMSPEEIRNLRMRLEQVHENLGDPVPVNCEKAAG